MQSGGGEDTAGLRLQLAEAMASADDMKRRGQGISLERTRHRLKWPIMETDERSKETTKTWFLHVATCY